MALNISQTKGSYKLKGPRQHGEPRAVLDLKSYEDIGNAIR